MKKMKQLLSVVVLFVACLNVNAQSNESTTEFNKDYLLGVWKLMAYGLPDGDTEMTVTFKKEDNELVGWVGSGNLEDDTKFERIEDIDDGVTAYYSAAGYDVYMSLEKDEKDTIIGNIMDMFDLEGARVKD